MTNPRTAIVLALTLLAALSLPSASSACGPTDACNDLSASLWGSIEGSLVTVHWTSDDVDSSIAGFVISRYTNPQFLVGIGSKNPVTGCTSHQYDDSDTPPAGTWTYRVCVTLTDNSTACCYDVTP